MSGDLTPSFDDIESTLRQAGALSEVAEIHGQLFGLVCVMGDDAAAPWIADALADLKQADAAISVAAQTLGALADSALEAMKEGDMRLQLLLPDDQSSMDSRADSLGLWCQGFLHGLGVGGSAADREENAQATFWDQEPVREIVADLSEIARAGFAADDDDNEAETAYAELVEFVRVSVQLLYEELRILRSDADAVKAHS